MGNHRPHTLSVSGTRTWVPVGWPGLPLVSVLGARQPVGLVVDLDRDLGQSLGVLPVVVGTEQELARAREHYTYICLRTASVAHIGGVERLGRGHRSGH